MAVPVDGVRIIFEAVLNTFAGIKYSADNYSFDPLLHENHIDQFNEENPKTLYLLEKEPEYMAV